MWAAIIIGSVIWASLWLLQFHYARMVNLAAYSSLGKKAWTTPDIFLHGVIGFFLSPIFFIVVMADYLHDKEETDAFHTKKKIEEGSIDLKKVKKTKDITTLQQSIEYKNMEIVQIQYLLDKEKVLSADYVRTIDELTTDRNSLKVEVERLKKLTKSVERFGLMDFDESKK